MLSAAGFSPDMRPPYATDGSGHFTFQSNERVLVSLRIISRVTDAQQSSRKVKHK
jgi:hypothetical protein